MLASGFKDASVSKLFLASIVATSIAASVTDTKYLFYIQVVPHFWQYRQFWRIFSWQLCFTNSTEVLFATMTVYHMRVIERLWGSRKFASFLLSTLPYTMLLPPLLLSLVFRPLSFGAMNYLPAGPTAILFAILAQYHATIPQVYKYRVATSAPQDRTQPPPGVLFSDKSTTYLVAGQLALSQFPGSLISALVGWVVGKAWRRELLPGASWRMPGWLLMQKTEGDRYEGLRRRLEGETAASGASSAIDGPNTNAQRRPVGSQILDQFRNL